MSDGVEINQGSDPTDDADRMHEQWVVLTGDRPKDDLAQLTTAVTVPPRYKCLVMVFAASEEYPYYTGQSSEFNDALYWHVSATGCTTLTDTIRVNDEDGAWSDAEMAGLSVCGFSPVVLEGCAMYEAGATPLTIDIVLRAINIKDGALPSSVIVGVFPFEVVQENMPTVGGLGGTTDAGTSYRREILGTNSVAYITGEPAVPRIVARFKGLSEWIDVVWSGALTTERSERGTLDNRTLESETLSGGDSYSITEALSNEIVGGSVSLQAAVSGFATVRHPFRIRGKNPLDATAKAYIDANVDAEFRDYAWMIAKHESRDATTFQVYNQFNPSSDKRELPNLGAPDGWGMCQIDRSRNRTGIRYTTTAETYDWHESVAAMNAKLRLALSTYNRFVGYYRDLYGSSPYWVEPDNVIANISGNIVSAREWSVLTFYNGTGGCPSRNLQGRNRNVPLEFVVVNGHGEWLLYPNDKDYVRLVIDDSQRASNE